jgi:hypothetical protein
MMRVVMRPWMSHPAGGERPFVAVGVVVVVLVVWRVGKDLRECAAQQVGD